MFEVGFTELILIAGLALVVLGPERLPALATQIGRWVGRARAMARQLRDQLDQEVNLKQEPWRTRPPAGAAAEPDDDSHYYPEGRSHSDAGEDPVPPGEAREPPAAAESPAGGSAGTGSGETESVAPESATAHPKTPDERSRS